MFKNRLIYPFILLAACGRAPERNADLSYGYLKDSEYHLVKKKDGATVRICAENDDIFKVAIWTINAWTAPLGRKIAVSIS